MELLHFRESGFATILQCKRRSGSFQLGRNCIDGFQKFDADLINP
jgi:hypothetical protein